MHSVQLLEEALRVARRLGYHVRQEWIGSGGGPCEIRGTKWLFVDLSQSVLEQLQCVREAIEAEPGLSAIPLSTDLQNILRTRRAA